jgi:hypothetical protein
MRYTHHELDAVEALHNGLLKGYRHIADLDTDQACLQSEFQLRPQYTEPILIYKQTTPYNTANPYTITQPTTIRRLSCYHYPLSKYYQPSPHIWVGAGFSYDRLFKVTGIAKEVKSRPGMSDSVIISAKVDLGYDSTTGGNSIAQSEGRWTLAFQYDWKRFTLGLSDDRAFTDFINAQNLPGVGSARGRNQSLRFHLRWTFYERRKKTPSPPK